MRLLVRGLIAALRSIPRLLMVLTLIGLLALNVATLVSQTVFTTLSYAVSAVWGGVTVAKQIAQLNVDLAASKEEGRRAKADLADSKEVGRKAKADLEREKLRSAESTKRANATAKELDRTRAEAKLADQRKYETKAKVRAITRRISKRTAAVALQNAASTVGEALPFVGAAVIVVATGSELAAACQTMDDMQELAELDGPSESAAVAEQATRVCGVKVNVSHIYDQIAAGPAQVWANMQALYPEKLPEYSAPDLSSYIEWIGEQWAEVGRNLSGE